MVEEWTADRIIQILQEKEKIQDMEQIMNSRYLEEQKEYLVSDWQKDEIPNYIKNKGDISTIARFRVGNEFKENKKWLEKEERICRLCKTKQESAEHVLEKCSIMRSNKSVREILSEDGGGIKIMKEILWKRKNNPI